MALSDEHRSTFATRLSSGSTFGISALLSSFSWTCTLTTSSYLDFVHVSFVSFAFEDIYLVILNDFRSKSSTRDDSPFPLSTVYERYDREDLRFEISGSRNILRIRLGISSVNGEWVSVLPQLTQDVLVTLCFRVSL